MSWSKKSLGTTVLNPVKVSLLRLLRGLETILLGNVWANVIQAMFPDLYLPPNDPDSCLPQLLQQPPVLFRETSSAKAICMDCSSSFRGKGRVGVCHFRVDQKKRMWWSDDNRREKKSAVQSDSCLCVGGVKTYYSAKKCKHANAIDQTTRGQWQSINYAHWSYLGCPK